MVERPRRQYSRQSASDNILHGSITQKALESKTNGKNINLLLPAQYRINLNGLKNRNVQKEKGARRSKSDSSFSLVDYILKNTDPQIKKMCEEMQTKRVKIRRMTRRGFKDWCQKYLINAKLRQVVQEEDDEMDSWGDISHNRAMHEHSVEYAVNPLIDVPESARSHRQIATDADPIDFRLRSNSCERAQFSHQRRKSVLVMTPQAKRGAFLLLC